jgi:hypothetical protein
MYIHDEIDCYKILIDKEDLTITGYTLDELILNLIEASSLIGNQLGEYHIKENLTNESWTVYIHK